jgi:hypothetical protein
MIVPHSYEPKDVEVGLDNSRAPSSMRKFVVELEMRFSAWEFVFCANAETDPAPNSKIRLRSGAANKFRKDLSNQYH